MVLVELMFLLAVVVVIIASSVFTNRYVSPEKRWMVRLGSGIALLGFAWVPWLFEEGNLTGTVLLTLFGIYGVWRGWRESRLAAA